MASALRQPWFSGCIELVNLHRQDRALLVLPSLTAQALAVADRVGPQGNVLCVETDRRRAEELAGLGPAQVEVVCLSPTGHERFGSFDALVGCPLASPRWDVRTWAAMTVHNLRPGGRFVLDLPAPEMSEEFAACWVEAGGDEAALAPLRGPDDEELAASLREAGLRRVQALLATELIGLDSPHDLAELCSLLPPAEETMRTELGKSLARRLKSTGSVEVLLRRTRVHGIR